MFYFIKGFSKSVRCLYVSANLLDLDIAVS